MDAAVRGGGGGGGDAAAEIAALRAENADLKVELDALDPAFFDEVMEMKRAYHEQSRTLDRYEATLADYAERLGVSFTPARRASGER
jgi:centrosomal protein CEP290